MRAVWKGAVAMLRFLEEFLRFRKMAEGLPPRLPIRWENRLPCLKDKTTSTPFDRHYVYHPAWAARVLARTQPASHVDISSTLHFCTVVSAFIPVRFYDYRPASLDIDNLSTGSADLLSLPFGDRSIPSLSCMHVAEHVGLGRYGDPMDPEGDRKAMAELQRVLATGGSLLFVVPVGEPRVVFNAHRIYSRKQVLESFPELELVESALIPDDHRNGGLLLDPPEEMMDAQSYGCGCFWFRRTR